MLYRILTVIMAEGQLNHWNILPKWLVVWLTVVHVWHNPPVSCTKHRRNLLTPHHRTNATTSACNVKLPPKCQCNNNNGYSFTCANAKLHKVPKIDFGPNLIRTINLVNNKLERVEMGDFFGLKIEKLLLGNNSIVELPLLSFWGLEYNLEILDLSYNKLKVVPADALKLLRNLRSLSLIGNQITVLNHYDFGYLPRLEVLTLNKNPIHVVSPTAFAGLHLFLLNLDHIELMYGLEAIPTEKFKDLRGISLAKNSIDHIPASWFQQFSILQLLCLDRNKIDDIPVGTFAGVETSLRTLQLNSNYLKKIPVETLSTLTKVETLELSDNRISKIYPGSFNQSHLLQFLDLSKNLINEVSAKAFVGLDNVQRIDLRFNKIITLDDRTFAWPQPEGKQVYLADNPWLCNCMIQWVKREVRRKSAMYEVLIDVKDWVCARPAYLEGYRVTRTSLEQFTCDHDYYIYTYTYDDYEDDIEELSGSGTHYGDLENDLEKDDDVYDDQIPVMTDNDMF